MYSQTTVLCSLLFLAIAPYSSNAMTAEQKATVKAHFEQVGMKCIKDNPITPDDIKELKAKTIPSGAGVPCFLACVMKDVGVLDDAGMLQKEDLLDLAKTVFDDEEELKNISDYLHSCSPVNSEAVSDGAKGCDRAMLAYKCMLDNAAKFGIEM